MRVRTLLVSTLIVPLSIAFALSRPEMVLACSCAVPPTPAAGWTAEDLTDDYDLVFRGYVIDAGPVRDLGGGLTDGTYVVSMAAATVWAGPARATYQVRAGHGGGDCTIAFAPGQEWLIFAYGNVTRSESIGTDICTRTMLATDSAADFHASILGEGTQVVDLSRLRAVGAAPVIGESLVTLLLLAEELELRG